MRPTQIIYYMHISCYIQNKFVASRFYSKLFLGLKHVMTSSILIDFIYKYNLLSCLFHLYRETTIAPLKGCNIWVLVRCFRTLSWNKSLSLTRNHVHSLHGLIRRTSQGYRGSIQTLFTAVTVVLLSSCTIYIDKAVWFKLHKHFKTMYVYYKTKKIPLFGYL